MQPLGPAVDIYQKQVIQQQILRVPGTVPVTAKGVGYMISNQILQNTIDGLKSIARVELCVMDVARPQAHIPAAARQIS